MRTGVGYYTGLVVLAAAVVGEVQKGKLIPDFLEETQNDRLAGGIEWAEPGLESVRAFRESLDVIVGRIDDILGCISGSKNIIPLARIAECECSPLVMDMPGDGELTKELDLSDTVDSGIQVLEGAISIDVSEEIRRCDGVVSGAGLSEVVCDGDWDHPLRWS